MNNLSKYVKPNNIIIIIIIIKIYKAQESIKKSNKYIVLDFFARRLHFTLLMDVFVVHFDNNITSLNDVLLSKITQNIIIEHKRFIFIIEHKRFTLCM